MALDQVTSPVLSASAPLPPAPSFRSTAPSLPKPALQHLGDLFLPHFSQPHHLGFIRSQASLLALPLKPEVMLASAPQVPEPSSLLLALYLLMHRQARQSAFK